MFMHLARIPGKLNEALEMSMHHMALILPIHRLAVNDALLPTEEHDPPVGLDLETCNLLAYIFHDIFFDESDVKLTVLDPDPIHVDLILVSH